MGGRSFLPYYILYSYGFGCFLPEFFWYQMEFFGKRRFVSTMNQLLPPEGYFVHSLANSTICSWSTAQNHWYNNNWSELFGLLKNQTQDPSRHLKIADEFAQLHFAFLRFWLFRSSYCSFFRCKQSDARRFISTLHPFLPTLTNIYVKFNNILLLCK